MSDALWHGLIGGLSIVLMYLIYYLYKGIRNLIKNPASIHNLVSKLKCKTGSWLPKGGAPKKPLTENVKQKREKGINLVSHVPLWVTRGLIGLLSLGCIAGSGYGIYRLFDDLIIPERNAREDWRLIEMAQERPFIADSVAIILHNSLHHNCKNNRLGTSSLNWHESQARDLLHLGARSGDVKAQLHLGIAYESFWKNNWEDITVSVYHRKPFEKTKGGEFGALQHAAYWFKQASDAGCMEARGRLGVCYYLGNGCEYLPMAGERYIKEAADSGIAQFQYIYGVLLEKGLTGAYIYGSGNTEYFRTESQLSLAKEYWNLAAKQGYEPAISKLEKLY
ncbi:MAG: sel1 repeat family protein [Bacteroidales bacterium]|nr:sel1 repeat family protein [Bacteroidales bacterium]